MAMREDEYKYEGELRGFDCDCDGPCQGHEPRLDGIIRNKPLVWGRWHLTKRGVDELALRIELAYEAAQLMDDVSKGRGRS